MVKVMQMSEIVQMAEVAHSVLVATLFATLLRLGLPAGFLCPTDAARRLARACGANDVADVLDVSVALMSKVIARACCAHDVFYVLDVLDVFYVLVVLDVFYVLYVLVALM